ncbi:MAG: hypothetical protein LBF26_01750 [Puniceicoccales bacterium]|jgi:hypothetical protein|nr:hypothetical protein [Puniceicoccales bacterium]
MKIRKFLLACALAANFTHISVLAREAGPVTSPIWAQVQVYGPQRLVVRAIDHARNIYPHPSLHILPAVFLGAWGYPDFQGLSQEDPITVTFFQGSDDKHGLNWVARAKFTESSPVNSAIEMQELKSKKIGEWTIVGRNGEIISRAESEPDELFPASDQSLAFPSIRILLTDVFIKSLVRDFETTVLQNIAQSQTLERSMPAISLLNLALTLARQIDGVECQLGVSDENLEIQFSIHAGKGSDLAMLFDAPVDGGKMAKLEAFLPSGDGMRWFCRSNPSVTKLFVHHFFDALFIYNEDRSIADASDRDIYNFFDSVWSLYGGLTVAQTTIFDGEKPAICKLWAASLTPDQLGIWVDFVYNKIVPLMVGEVAKMFWAGEIAFDTKAVPKAFTHKKHTISRATVKMSLMDGDTARHQYNESHYYCAFGDFVAVTNSKKTMYHLIDEMTSGGLPRTVENGLTLDQGTVFRLQSGRVPELQKYGFPPLDLSVKFDDGTAIFKMNIKSKLFGKWLHSQNNNPIGK